MLRKTWFLLSPILFLLLSGAIAQAQTFQFTNNTGRQATDLHVELSNGASVVNIVTDPTTGVKRLGGVFARYPSSGSPTNQDYSQGTVANGDSVTIQYQTTGSDTRVKKWWWTGTDDRGRTNVRISDIFTTAQEIAMTLPRSSDHAVLFAGLDAKAIGTGRTTGHIATLTVSNPGKEDRSFDIGPVLIPATGKYQSYVVPGSYKADVPAGQTRSIELQGYCADIHRPPVPDGENLPPPSEWIDPRSAGPLPYPGWTPSEDSGFRPASPEQTGAIPTYPGTNVPFPYTIDVNAHPQESAPLILQAINSIGRAYDEFVKEGKVKTPFSSDPEKERESVIQQSFWLYTAALTGTPYKVQDFEKRLQTQFEETTGKPVSEAPPENQKSLKEGVSQFWSAFEIVGKKAKIIQ